MTPRFRLAFVAGIITFVGCTDAFNSGPLSYTTNERIALDLPEKPRLRAAIGKALDKTYGSSPKVIRVPKGAPLQRGGLFLANSFEIAGSNKVQHAAFQDQSTGKVETIVGGYALYRKHCLHCHGVSGDGIGPTSEFLFPRPRDFRRGMFKFTSTTGPKPTREDVRKTLVHGIPGTSMPTFEALLTPSEVEQVLDYTIFLSLRGETELSLLNEATVYEEADAETLFDAEMMEGILGSIFENWKTADEQVLVPETPRVPPTKESIARGKLLFLGRTPEKLECAGCHGSRGDGNGPSYIDPSTFNEYVFGGDPSKERIQALRDIAEKANKKWGDEWGNPLRPANLNQGIYKGGRRPLDIYWRIAKGITGTPMPGHASAIKPDQIWDVVNFVLALPYDRGLLKDVPSNALPAPHAVAGR